MAFPHRKLLIIPTPNVTVDPKSVAFCCCDYGEKCSLSRYKNCPVYAKCFVLLPSPPPPPRQLPPVVVPQSRDTNNGLRELVIGALTIWACVITAALLLGLLFALGGAFYLRNRSRGRRDSPIIFGTQEDLSNEDRGPQVDRHIRYITTVGLPQSVIDSIAVFKYKNDDGLIDGTECSVCLNEFREAEVLRLLPKCSHAFHVPCIDTWLRSQRNCPLCRAAIISDAVVSESGSSSSALDSRNENVVMNLGNHNRDGSSDMAEGDSGDGRIGCDDSLAMSSDEDASENSNNDLPSRVRNGEYDPRVLSDLTDNRRVVEVDIQPMRRSVSLDLSSAVMIYNDVAGGGVHETQNSMLNTGIVNAKKLKSRSVSKRSTGSAGITKLMKSASLGIGTSLLKGPISMKRSWSSGG